MSRAGPGIVLTPARHSELAEAQDVTVAGRAAGVVGRVGSRWEFRTYDGGRGEVATREAAVATLVKLAR